MKYFRLGWLVLCVWMFVAVLIVRLVVLQGFQHEYYRGKLNDQLLKTFPVHPNRGMIFDRHEFPLAMTTRSYSAYVMPSSIENKNDFLVKVSGLLPLSKRALQKKLAIKSPFIWLVKHVDEKTYQRAKKRDIAGLGFMKDTKRIYPNADVGAHVLGFVGDYNQGLGGVEYLYESQLKGQSGKIVLEGDPRGRQMITGFKHVLDPKHGVNIMTTLDHFVQYRAQVGLDKQMKKYDAEKGSVIVIDLRNGEVLAMANVPTFDPNNWRHVDWSVLRNPSVTDIYEPGSVFKVITIAAALNENLVKTDTVLNVPEEIFRYRRKIREAHKRDPEDKDSRSVHDILKDSLNVGTTLIAEKMGEELFYKYIQKFGIGEKTGIELPGESQGLLRPLSQWSGVDLAMHSFGQGVAVTPLQMVMAMSVVANDGVLLKPKVIRYLSYSKNKTIQAVPKTVHRQVIRPEIARKICHILTDVVDTGTAQIVKIDGYSIAGKTGTAQKPKSNGIGYEKGKYVSSFMGFFPAKRPQYLIAVVIDSPKKKYYGSTVAGPVFRALALDMIDYYHLPPDRDMQSNRLRL